MEAIEPFRVMDCSLVRLATGQMCSNLRELLDAVRTVHETVLEHHMMRLPWRTTSSCTSFPTTWPAGAGPPWATTCWASNWG